MTTKNKLIMVHKPKIKLKLTKVDIIFEMIGWLFIVAIWHLTFINYSNLPDTIPIHHYGERQPDGYAGKITIFILPSVITILFITLTIINEFPHAFNYITNITPSNAFTQYTQATRLVRYLKIIIVVVFGLIVLNTTHNTNKQINEIGKWFLPLTVGLNFIPLLYFIIKSYRKKK